MVSVHGSRAFWIILSPSSVPGDRCSSPRRRAPVAVRAGLFGTVYAAPMRPTLPVTAAHGKQRSPQAGKRVDATDAQGVAFAALGVLGQFQLCFGRERIVIYRRCSPSYEMIVEDLT